MSIYAPPDEIIMQYVDSEKGKMLHKDKDVAENLQKAGYPEVSLMTLSPG